MNGRGCTLLRECNNCRASAVQCIRPREHIRSLSKYKRRELLREQKTLSEFQNQRLAFEAKKRILLQRKLIQEYEEEAQPKWSRKLESLSEKEDYSKKRTQSTEDEDVHTGIFWDIENVTNL